mgnify:CR=1 FL=1
MPVLIELVAASLLWAFSFGLIKRHLADADPFAVAAARLAISLLAFLPWLRRARLPRGLRRRGMAWGALQFGAMYALYLAAYRDLPAYGVALFTVTTPLFVAALEDARARRASARHAAAALLAVAGAATVFWRDPAAGPAWWRGALLVQASNLCFAAGTVAFRALAAPGASAGVAAGLTAWMYLGAVLLTGPLALVGAGGGRLDLDAAGWGVLAYLGLVPTALGFFLWNRGATRAPAGLVAAANNLKVPLGVAISWLVFGERADPLRAAAGGAVIVLALAVAREKTATRGFGRRAAGA